MIGEMQINDSLIIATILAKIVDVPYTESESEIEKLSTSGLMIALEISVMEDTQELQKCGCTMGGCLGSCLWTIACCIPCCGVSGPLRKKFPDIKKSSDYGKDYADLLSSKPFFHGDTVGVIDCSIFGLLLPFRKAKSQSYADFIGSDNRLSEWVGRMDALDGTSPTVPVVVTQPATSVLHTDSSV